MEKRKTIIICISILVFLGFVITGCGGKSDEDKLEELNERMENAKSPEDIEAIANQIEKLEAKIKSNVKTKKVELGKQITDMEKWDSCKSKIAPIESAIDTFLLNTNYYPKTLDELIVNPGLNGWAGPYLKEKQLYDPWDNPYTYLPYKGGYDLISYGADGVKGGEGYNQDIYNK